MKGHVGVFLGKEVNCGDGICNVVECTSAWNRGIQFSYVDKNGGRFNKLNGKQIYSWTKHGLPLEWVYYFNNCIDKVSPNDPKDCVLSKKDKEEYDYCCYEGEVGINSCIPYNEKDYKEKLELYEYLWEYDKFAHENGLNYTFICNTDVLNYENSLRPSSEEQNFDSTNIEKDPDFVTSNSEKIKLYKLLKVCVVNFLLFFILF